MKHIQGMAMFDILISLGIISFVLLSLLSYQITMMNAIEQSDLKTIANAQLLNFSEALLIHASDAGRAVALTSWNTDNAHLLPRGMGDYVEISDHQCDIRIHWVFKRRDTEKITVYC